MKSVVKKIAAVVLVSVFNPLCLAADNSVGGKDITSVVQMAINNQPEVQARWHALLVSMDQRRQVAGGWYPSVDLRADVGGAQREFDKRGSFWRHNAEVSITQLLFDGYSLSSQIREADYQSLRLYYEFMDTLENMAMDAVNAFEEAEQYRKTHELAKQNVRVHMEFLKKIQERNKRGVSNGADFAHAEGRLSLAKANLLTEEANLHTVRARFERLVGFWPSTLGSGRQVSENKIPSTLAGVLQMAQKSNPSLYVPANTIGEAEASYQQSRSTRYPRFLLRARHGKYMNMNSFDTKRDSERWGDETIVEVKMDYNLYRGGSDRAAERAAAHRISQSKDLQDKACVDLRQTASIAWRDYHNLGVKIDVLAKHAENSAKVVVAYRNQFDIGRRTLIDVLDAENEAFQSKRALVRGKHELLMSKYRTLHAMGQLLSELGVAREGLPSLDKLSENVKHKMVVCNGY